jgi:hypothetical protein
MSQISVGDTVAYSRAWLQSVGLFIGPEPHARGKIIEIKNHGKDFAIASIDWNDPDIPGRVNVMNLVRVTLQGMLEPV